MNGQLLQLQKEIYISETNDFETKEKFEYSADDSAKLYFFPAGKYFDIYFYGEGYDEMLDIKAKDFGYKNNFPFCGLLDLICEQKNAEKIISLTFDGPDEGANGTNGWDFTRIINSNAVFPNLKSLKIKLTGLGDHNQCIIDSGGSMEEDGMIAKMISKMPKLETLVVPSAPDSTFFDIGKHPLVSLTVQTGYDEQGFIGNLAGCDNFEQLQALDFTDNISAWEEMGFVPFDSYKKLFRSKIFQRRFHFKLRNSNLSKEQLFELQKLNKDVQFLYIKAKDGEYVSHLLNG